MRVCFVATPAQAGAGPFAVYGYREDLVGRPHYIDIRGIVQRHSKAWLDDLAQSHKSLSASFSSQSVWWFSAFSRLDARPWGFEPGLKPFFFARAILQWAKENPGYNQISLIAAPAEVGMYLRDFDPLVRIKSTTWVDTWPRRCIKWWRQEIIFNVKFVEQLWCLFTKSFRPKKVMLQRCWVLFERFSPDQSLPQARDYFFQGLFDGLAHRGQISFACIDQLVFKGQNPLPEKDGQGLYVLDHVRMGDVIRAKWQNIGFYFALLQKAMRGPACDIAGLSSKKFWREFLFANFSKAIVLKEACVYQVLKRFADKKQFDTIVYPYEEKGYERAVLNACSHPVRTIGYAPHPQHHLAVGMKDDLKPAALRPSFYGVCGKAYVDYFEQWAGKPKGSVHVWGTAKGAQAKCSQKILAAEPQVFVLLSHPNELNVFASWLHAEPKLCRGVSFLVRRYQSVPAKTFQESFKAIMAPFPQVREADGDFSGGLQQCDVVVFNATSAGLAAVHQGKIAVHLALDDFFAINPCFDRLDAMLSCATAKIFAQRLEDLKSKGTQELEEIWRQQKEFVGGIFAPIDTKTIEQDLK